jgi:hypothetical protein
MNENEQRIISIIRDYIEAVEAELNSRWENWRVDLSEAEMYEVIGALLARMVTLATEMALAPQIWNEHIAPVILRSMADAYISLAWIFEAPLERSRKYILFGLGQAKLGIEYRKAQLKEDGYLADEDPIINATESWINLQRYIFLTEVKLGSWSDLTTRKMADEAGCIDFYNYVYSPFSAATHNMWHHIGRYNLRLCTNPLHGIHFVPADLSLNNHPDYLRLAAKYVQKAFDLFDKKTGVTIKIPNAFEELSKSLNDLKESANPKEDGIQ